jgi:hypothetical protein
MNRRTLIAGAVVAIAIIVFVMVVGLLRFNFTEVLPSWLWVRRGPELVLNGSFEDGNHDGDPTHGEPFDQFGKVLCAGSSALTSWQVFRQSKPMDCLAGADAVFWAGAPNNYQLPAGDGTYFLDLTGDAGRPPASFGGVIQEVKNTQPGSQYELSFLLGSAARFPAPQGSIAITVEIKGLPSQPSPFSSTVPTTGTKWETFTFRFTAPGPTTTLTFRGVAGGDYVGLDKVSLREVCLFFFCPSG